MSNSRMPVAVEEGERVLAVVVVEGATFRLESQPV